VLLRKGVEDKHGWEVVLRVEIDVDVDVAIDVDAHRSLSRPALPLSIIVLHLHMIPPQLPKTAATAVTEHPTTENRHRMCNTAVPARANYCAAFRRTRKCITDSLA
jgi:hypothetical protein